MMEALSRTSLSIHSSFERPKNETQAHGDRRDSTPLWRTQDVQQANRSQRNFWKKLLLNTWLPEITAMFTSAISTIAIIAVLRYYEDKATPDLSYGITLNAVVSALATASKSSLLFVVGSALSQLKWCWFQRDRRLQDIQTFDEASRGPLGSLLLVFELRWRSLASIGALVTVLALAFDPFVQQVLRYPIRSTPGPMDSSSVKKIQNFKKWESYVALMSVVETGIWSSPDALRIAPSCPSGNCKWEAFTSFEWCSKCTDVTESASVSCVSGVGRNQSASCHLKLANDGSTNMLVQKSHFYSDNPSDWISHVYSSWPLYTMDSFGPPNTELRGPYIDVTFPKATHLDVRSPLLAMSHVDWKFWGGVSDNGNHRTEVNFAEKCILTPCMKHYNVSVHHGIPQIETSVKVYGSLKGYAYAVASDGRMYDTSLCWAANAAHPTLHDLESTAGDYSNATAGIFCVGRGSPYGPYKATMIAASLSGHATRERNVKRHIESLDGAWSSYTMTEGDSVAMRLAVHNMSYLLESVAESLSQGAREASTEVVPGVVLTEESFVRVRWQWLILPFVLDAAGLVVLIIAIVSTRHHQAPLWKDSLLPLLYHGMEMEDRSVATDAHGMEIAAERDIVSLDQSDAQRIVLRCRMPGYVSVNT